MIVRWDAGLRFGFGICTRGLPPGRFKLIDLIPKHGTVVQSMYHAFRGGGIEVKPHGKPGSLQGVGLFVVQPVRAHVEGHAENRGVGMDAPADPVGRLETDDAKSCRAKRPGGRDARRPGTDDQNVKVKDSTRTNHRIPRSIGMTLAKSKGV